MPAMSLCAAPGPAAPPRAARRRIAMTVRKAIDAISIRTALNACGLSSRNALLMTG
jgi:hypothetical protein